MTYHSPAGRPPNVGSVRLPVARPACPPLVDHAYPEQRLGMPPTPRQLEVLAEVIIHGRHQEAADCLGVSLLTVRGRVNELYARIGATDGAQAARLLGWTRFPKCVVRDHRLPEREHGA